MTTAVLIVADDEKALPTLLEVGTEKADKAYVLCPVGTSVDGPTYAQRTEIIYASDLSEKTVWTEIVDRLIAASVRLKFLVIGPRRVINTEIFNTDPHDMASTARRNVMVPWISLKHCLPLMTSAGASAVVLVASSGQNGKAFEESEHAALSLMTEAVTHDAAVLGLPVRVNRLRFDPADDMSSSLKPALAFLLGPRSSFMAGAELSLAGPAEAKWLR